MRAVLCKAYGPPESLVVEEQLVVLHVAMEIVESSCLVEHEREPASAVVLGVG